MYANLQPQAKHDFEKNITRQEGGWEEESRLILILQQKEKWKEKQPIKN